MYRFRDERLMGRLAATLSLAMIITAFPAVSSPQGAGERIVTNYEVLEKVSGEAVDEISANMPGLARDTVILIRKEEGVSSGIDQVFENVLVSRMMDAGLRISEKTSQGAEGGDSDFTFSYQIVNLSLKYPRIGRSYWVGTKEVERLAEVAVFVKILDSASGEIVWVGEAQKKYEDRIAYSLLERVEDPAHDFTMPPRNEVRWSRFIEPVVVTGIVVGLVYLFFSNQDSE